MSAIILIMARLCIKYCPLGKNKFFTTQFCVKCAWQPSILSFVHNVFKNGNAFNLDEPRIIWFGKVLRKADRS